MVAFEDDEWAGGLRARPFRRDVEVVAGEVLQARQLARRYEGGLHLVLPEGVRFVERHLAKGSGVSDDELHWAGA
jgi:hypothetical protein